MLQVNKSHHSVCYDMPINKIKQEPFPLMRSVKSADKQCVVPTNVVANCGQFLSDTVGERVTSHAVSSVTRLYANVTSGAGVAAVARVRLT